MEATIRRFIVHSPDFLVSNQDYSLSAFHAVSQKQQVRKIIERNTRAVGRVPSVAPTIVAPSRTKGPEPRLAVRCVAGFSLGRALIKIFGGSETR
jgi:hypothetical protein